MAEPRAANPYRQSAKEDEGPVRRGSVGCVTGIGALGILAVIAFFAVGAASELGRERAVRSASDTFAPSLTDSRVIEIASHFDPLEQSMPAPPELGPGEQTDVPYVARIESVDGHPAVESNARGLLVTSGVALDAAQIGRSRRAAATPDDVRWVGVIERQVVHDAYRYASVGVDVERAFIVLVDLETQRPITRITMDAAPPSHTGTPREIYALEDRRIWQAIERALR